jgi:dTDP-4-amino-4,6-dideoxygalactose transaminase
LISYGFHSISNSDIRSVKKVLKSHWLTTGPMVEKFELEIEKIVNAPCVVVSSGTAALHCAYAAIDLRPGDEVITPPLTFIATQAAAAFFGAKIIFADIQLDTGNIDPMAVEAAITNRTKAIVAVDFAGHPADLEELRVIANKYGIFFIEDASHSFGSRYKNQPVGSIADITTFSFFPTKNITTGEGGAIASIHKDLLDKARKFARQGLVRNQIDFKIRSEGPWHQEVQNFGLNYRLPDILCALGISQLNKLYKFKEKKSIIAKKYSKSFETVKGLSCPTVKPNVDINWHLYPLRVDPDKRLAIYLEFRNANIGVQVNYMPAHWHPVFQEFGYKRGMFPMSELFYSQEISLPIHPKLSNKQVRSIIEFTKGLVR